MGVGEMYAHIFRGLETLSELDGAQILQARETKGFRILYIDASEAEAANPRSDQFVQYVVDHYALLVQRLNK